MVISLKNYQSRNLVPRNQIEELISAQLYWTCYNYSNKTSTAAEDQYSQVEDVLQLRAPHSLPVVEQCSQQTLEDPAVISIQIRKGPQAEALINTNINFPLKESIVSGPNTLQITTQVLGSFTE